MLEHVPGDTIYFEDNTLYLLDQALLPTLTIYLELQTPDEVVDAIKRLAVRGAMAIGIAGAYGALLGALGARTGNSADIAKATREAIAHISASRPTARNLFWALERMEEALEQGSGDEPKAVVERLHERADEIALDTIETNRALVDVGQQLITEGMTVLTHCNSGPLAALRYGTALGVLIEAHRRGRHIHVYADETRPLLQGSRLTAWELGTSGVPYTILPDNAAAALMKQGRVDAVMTGADRIASNGDTANKIGTYSIAVLARVHGIPFYIAAPGSTIDMACAGGADMVIEERNAEEVRSCGGAQTAPRNAPAFNPAFDITPAEYIEAIVTEKGIIRPPYEKNLRVFGK